MSITVEGDASLPNYIKHYKKNVTTVIDRDLPLFSTLHSVWYAT
jgi:hypothetical protein